MPTQPFTRVGQPVRISVSATSAVTPFDSTSAIPMTESALTFMFVNPNPFDVRLEGTSAGSAFVAVTATTGWLILARERTQVFTSKRPIQMSVQAFSSPGNPLVPGFDYSNTFIELVYGRGG
jgi:hypothetical protein